MRRGDAKLTQAGAWLRLWLQANAMKQVEFAGMLGVKKTQLYRWMHGRVVPSVRYARRIEVHTGLPMGLWTPEQTMRPEPPRVTAAVP